MSVAAQPAGRTGVTYEPVIVTMLDAGMVRVSFPPTGVRLASWTYF